MRNSPFGLCCFLVPVRVIVPPIPIGLLLGGAGPTEVYIFPVVFFQIAMPGFILVRVPLMVVFVFLVVVTLLLLIMMILRVQCSYRR